MYDDEMLNGFLNSWAGLFAIDSRSSLNVVEEFTGRLWHISTPAEVQNTGRFPQFMVLAGNIGLVHVDVVVPNRPARRKALNWMSSFA